MNTTAPTQSAIRHEMELLVCCARTHVSPATAARIQELLAAELDWQVVLARSTQHSVLPLLYKNLSAICPDAVPATVLTQLQQLGQQHVFHNLRLTRELFSVLALLQTHEIQAIPFKGAVLAAAAYGNITLRKFSDLDILVQPDDYLKAIALLRDRGYQPVIVPWFFSEAEEAAFCRTRGEYTLANRDRTAFIDLHARLIAGDLFALSADFDYVWQRLVPAAIGGQTLLSLCPEDLLIYLCVHGTKSVWERLGWICDLAELIRAFPQMNWEDVTAQAQALGVERMLKLGLSLAHALLAAPIPAAMLQSIQADAIVRRLTTAVQHRLYSGNDLPKALNFEKFAFHFQAMQRHQDRVSYASKYVLRCTLNPVRKLIRPTANDRQFLALSPAFYGIYYLLRPFRLCIQSFDRLWQHLQLKRAPKS